MVALMPVVPMSNPLNGKITLAGNATVAAANQLHRNDSLSVVCTDAPEEEVERDRRQRHGDSNKNKSPSGEDRLNFISIANASMAALAWRRQTSHSEDIEVCPLISLLLLFVFQ